MFMSMMLVGFDGMPDKINMTKVIAHEFGHYLGFDHFESDPSNIMYPSIGSAAQKWGASQSQLFVERNN